MAKILCDTKGMPEEDWLKMREHGPAWNDPQSPDYIDYCIGGSAVATVFNVSPWVTALELFHQKKGVEPVIPTNFNEEAKEAGHKYEPYVADTFKRHMEEEGHTVELIEDTNFYQQDDEEWAVANVDYRIMVDGEECILECKTTNYENTKGIIEWKKGVCPIYYLLQVMFYLWVLDLNTAYICCCWGFYQKNGSSYSVIKIERNRFMEEKMVAGLKAFVAALRNNTPPATELMNQELLMNYYYRLFGPADPDFNPVKLNDALRPDIEALMKAQEELAEKEKAVKEAELKIKQLSIALAPIMQGVEYGSLDLGNGEYISVKQVSPTGRTKYLDIGKLKQERPDLYAEFLEETYVEGFYPERDYLLQMFEDGLLDESEFKTKLEDLKELYITEKFNEEAFKKKHSRGTTLAKVVERFFYKEPNTSADAYNKFKIEVKKYKK